MDAAGGVDKIRSLLMDANRLAKSNAKILSEVSYPGTVSQLTSQAMDILDQEAHETEQLIERQPHLAESRPPSHVANQSLIANAGQYDATLKQAAGSDAMVRTKWEEWRNMIEILSGGEVSCLLTLGPNSSRISSPTTSRPPRRAVAVLPPCLLLSALCVRPSRTSMTVLRTVLPSLPRRARSRSKTMCVPQCCRRQLAWPMADQVMSSPSGLRASLKRPCPSMTVSAMA